ncbi:L,D-transpeptidase family protein [Streptomyces sp. enrichment culture]|uniref:L,D-transpeptidase family protein n=1 Tax=Streptomyces sp. enrichment culture TaxID=1795815 RepID=UPI003F5747D9
MASSIERPPRDRRGHRPPARTGRPPATVRVRARRRLPSAAVALVVTAVLAGCGAPAGPAPGATPTGGAAASGPAPAAPPSVAPAAGAPGGAGAAAPAPDPSRLPGLGPQALAQIPGDTRQVVVVTGRGKDSSRSEVVLHRRTARGWRAGPAWPAHNALRGWTDDHRMGDLRSPIGVFTLSDAGGLLPDPGTRLPYDESPRFAISGTGFEGEPLEGSFDYVIAIDYNREPGTSPLDRTRPLGADRGGGVWLHVDHDGPTQGCVSLGEEHMKELLRVLDPDQHPVVVMGDAASLLR